MLACSIGIIGRIYHLKALSEKVFVSDRKTEQSRLSVVHKT